MISTYLWRHLVVPVGIAGVLSLIASLFLGSIEWCATAPEHCSWLRDATMNIAFTAIGVLVTVLYIDRVIQRHEDHQWSGVAAVAQERTRRVASKTLMAVRFALGLPPPRFPFEDQILGHPGSLYQWGTRELIDTARTISTQDFLKLGEMDARAWQGFASNLEDARLNAERILEHLGPRLGASSQEQLLLLHRQLSAVHQCCELFLAKERSIQSDGSDGSDFIVPPELISIAVIRLTKDLHRTALSIYDGPND